MTRSRTAARHRSPADHGFTLVELLVVISIIFLLISVLLPALAKARRQAKVAACSSQERQIHIGLMAYTADTQGHYMPTTSLNFVGGLGFVRVANSPAYDSRAPLLQYISSAETFYCPDGSLRSDEVFSSALGGWHTSQSIIWITYAILAGAGVSDNPTLGLALDRAQTRWLGDAAWFEDGIFWVGHETEVVQPSKAPFLAA